MKLIYLSLLILNLGCSPSSKKKSENTVSDSLKKDTITEISNKKFLNIFKEISNTNKLLELDENGFLKIDSLKLKIQLIEKNNGKYDFIMLKDNMVSFKKNNIGGVSKFFIHQSIISFSIFNSFTDDGNNEGFAVLFDFKKNKVLTSNKVLENTCNPVFINQFYYLIDNLTLLRTDSTFKKFDSINIGYESKNDEMDYLDTFLICGLDTDGKNIIIKFSSNRGKIPCKSYLGNLDIINTKIILKDK